MNNSDKEIERIKNAYHQRDSLGLSKQYNFNNPAFIFNMQEREWAMLKMLKQINFSLDGTTIFEIGCGTGHILNRFLEFNVAQASGIELMENRVDLAKKHYPRIKIVQGNAEHLPYESNSFDLVMQFMCLSSILDRTMRNNIASEMWRVTKPGGVILSYDLRPQSSLIKFLSKTQLDSSLYPISIPDIKNLFPLGETTYCSLSLFPIIAASAKWSHRLMHILSLLPFLHTSFLVLIKKPID